MEIYVTFHSEVELAEQLINAEVIHFGIGSPNENRLLFKVRPKFYRLSIHGPVVIKGGKTILCKHMYIYMYNNENK